MPIASGAMISARGIAPTTRAILLAERRRINDPLPAVFGSVEPHHASPVRSNRARALAVAMPMSKQRVGCANPAHHPGQRAGRRDRRARSHACAVADGVRVTTGISRLVFAW